MCFGCLYHGQVVYACGVMFGLEALSPIGMELVEFPSATNGRGVLSMVIACVGRTMGKELLCSRRLLLGEESIVW